MRKYQITKRDDFTQQMTVCVDIIDERAQLMTIMDIQIDGDFEFFKYFPWHIYSVVYRLNLEKWCFENSEMFISMYYGDVDGKKEISVWPLYLSAPVITLLHGQQSGVDVEGKVVIQNNNDFGSIYYTTDGSTPTENSNVFEDGDYIDIIANTTVKAVVIYTETGLTSSVASLNVKMATLYALTNDPDYGICESLSGVPFPASGEKYYFDGSVVSMMIDIIVVPASGYDFVKFQSSNDGINWQDIQGGPFLTVDIGAGGTYYRRAVFEQVQPKVTLTFRINAQDDLGNPVYISNIVFDEIKRFISSSLVNNEHTNIDDWEIPPDTPDRRIAIYKCSLDVDFMTMFPTSIRGEGPYSEGNLEDITSEYPINASIYEGTVDFHVGLENITIDITYQMRLS